MPANPASHNGTVSRPAPLEGHGGADSAFEASALERSLGIEGASRWMGWRRRGLAVIALLGCLSLFGIARWLAATPHIDAQWRVAGDGSLVLQHTTLAAMLPLEGQVLLSLDTGAGPPLAVDARLLNHSPRWQAADAERARQRAAQQQLADGLAAGPVRLHFANGGIAEVEGRPRGLNGLGPLFWPLAALALVLFLFSAAVFLAQPRPLNLLYVAMALGQAAQLLLGAIESLHGLGLPPAVPGLDLDLRLALDAGTGAAAVHAFAWHPRRLLRAGLVAGAAWALAAAGVALVHAGALLPPWWSAQAVCLALGLLGWAVMRRSQRLESNPYARVMERFTLLVLAALLLVTTVVALAPGRFPGAPGLAAGAGLAWNLLLAALLLATPFLARSRRLLREFAVLAAIVTLATGVDLLFSALFSLGPVTALALAGLFALAVYTALRRLIGEEWTGLSLPRAERIFERIYRAAREVQERPARYNATLTQLLRELFDPLEMKRVDRLPDRSRVVGGGSVLVVPVRRTDEDGVADLALMLRFAKRGQRLFTLEDARLADRVVEQLRRAVAYDKAVEHGRSEERLRIAQDLHDDIGARLLTLMYQAPTPEMENYIRHTLQDLKTLTRGLAASEHRLSHAAAEWKADLTQRLAAAQAELYWSVAFDQDRRLSVVQWSAVTRVLRELVSNALYHGHATRIEVRMSLEGRRFSLQVADDGQGCEPQAWSHGLGLGGVRKRVKLLGGGVAWRENKPRGIVCDVNVQAFASVD
ncbi:membrane hypothetical protein [Rubrivivax sp. A210]|uniref:sensor histidine kinase n=1 Tax=Rubrivivax sp. A210 TaxID=2772301 RepID=UPI001919597E|nr:ATP-binding protein [Rubrivivax sp. A210]CAD5369858.1 membrane hypothetical protein [Rubrivivax sp. A210]